MISLPLIRDVQAAGRTVPQLTDVLTADFSKVVQQPQVTVILLNALAQSDTSIKVIGEAVQPRIVPYHVGITLIEVMANAGGLTDFADGQPRVSHSLRGRKADAVSSSNWLVAEVRRHAGKHRASAGRCDQHSRALVLTLCGG